MPWYLLLFLLLTTACGQSQVAETQPKRFVVEGKTMGTTYRILYYSDQEKEDLQARVDQLLAEVNKEISNWDSTSLVSQFNRSEEGLELAGSTHFLPNYELARQAWQISDGAFEPTIMPLTNYYGFGYGPKEVEGGIDSLKVRELMRQMGMHTLSLEGTYLRKSKPQVQLDLGGSAKGYGVDVVSKLLTDNGLNRHYVEIGGEVRTSGEKPDGEWTVGVNLPEEGAAFTDIVEVLPLTDRGMATSGNYRNYYQEGGQTYSHTINPKTGFPERNRLLSATVTAPTCGMADAIATACMVLGPERARRLIESNPELEAYFLMRAQGGDLEVWTSAGMSVRQ